VTLVGPGASLDAHARVADTISYELACGIGFAPARTPRTVVGP
jgi:alanine racemase